MRKFVRDKLREMDLQLPDLAKELNRSVAYVSRGLNGKGIDIREAFYIGDKLGFTTEQTREAFIC